MARNTDNYHRLEAAEKLIKVTVALQSTDDWGSDEGVFAYNAANKAFVDFCLYRNNVLSAGQMLSEMAGLLEDAYGLETTLDRCLSFLTTIKAWNEAHPQVVFEA